jgi:crotonobetainyl-CoA:carnitine CoA-transferase CaiB-like acyl-CoA transferase
MLGGIRVVDCTGPLGWLAGRLLADLGADVIKVEPPGAALDGAHWRALNVNKTLVRADAALEGGRAQIERLLEGADLLIATPRSREELDCARLAARYPRLIVVAITPFGLEGPKAQWQGSDIEIMAASGAMSLAGEPDGAPMRVSAPQSPGWAGAQAAVGALTALVARERTGRGQLVDVSAQAAVITALSHAPAFFDINGIVPSRAGIYITGRSVTGANYRVFWPCRDGFVNFILYGGTAGRRTNEQLVAWMRERAIDPGPLGAIDWARFTPTGATQAEVDAMEAPIARLIAGLTKREFLEGAHARRMLGYPVSSVADIAADPQLEARSFWQDVSAPDGRKERHCGAFVVVDGKRPALRSRPSERAASKPDARPAKTRAGALEGVRVIEFGGYAAGPHIGKILANFGATVLHVESFARPDGFRLQYPPYKDGKPGINAGGCFALFNDSKYGITVDLKKPAGIALARRLVDWGDIVIENMLPGVMERLGLGYQALRASNPDLIMLSSCNMGQTGPRAQTPGFGSQLSALAGLCGLTGEASGPPMLLYGPYIDFIASTMGAAAALAALERRARTGAGSYLDLSQYECGLLFLAGPLLDYHLNGRIAERCGNDDPDAAPHGVYPCANGGWLALSCWSDDEFVRLGGAIGQPQLGSAHAGLAGRKASRPAIDAAIGAWTRGREAGAAAEALQAVGVHAHPVNDMADLFYDAQLLARRQWRRRRHPVIGDHAYLFPAFDLSETPGDITAAAPLLGGDNELVLREFLGLTADEIESLRAQGALD